MSDSQRPHGLQPTRLLRPWDFLGKSTAVGCHSLLQGIFLTQGSYSGLLQCRQIPYHLSHQVKADNTILILSACVCAQSLSRVQLFVTPWTMAYQVSLSIGFSRSGLPFPPPGDLPDSGIKPSFPVTPALAGRFLTTGLPEKSLSYISYICGG